MITLHRAQPFHGHRQQPEVRFTSCPSDLSDPPGSGRTNPGTLKECRLPPGGVMPADEHHQIEVITYVCDGSLAFEDSTGTSGVIHAGEFQRTTIGPRLRRVQTNASPTLWTHLYQLRLHALTNEFETGYEQRRFSAAQRRGQLCIVASRDGRHGSLHLQHDVLMQSALLDKGQHVVHPLPPGRRAWVHLVAGEVALGDDVLVNGDGAGIEAERAVSLTACAETNILLLDVAASVPGDQNQDRPWRRCSSTG